MRVRDGAPELLQWASQNFNVGVWTAGVAEVSLGNQNNLSLRWFDRSVLVFVQYAKEIAENLDPEGSIFQFVISREVSCLSQRQDSSTTQTRALALPLILLLFRYVSGRAARRLRARTCSTTSRT